MLSSMFDDLFWKAAGIVLFGASSAWIQQAHIEPLAWPYSVPLSLLLFFIAFCIARLGLEDIRVDRR